MIEINLLPGSQTRKAKRSSAGPSLNLGAMLSGVTSQVKDPFMIMAAAGLVVGLGGLGVQWMIVGNRESDLTVRAEQAASDSSRYAGVLRERRRAEIGRDSVTRQLGVIRAIDGDRYIWAHILDEVSSAIPAFTWLTNIKQVSPMLSLAARDSAVALELRGPAPEPAKGDTSTAGLEPPPRLQVRLTGLTVDMQALTRYMRVLESSPFLEGVTLIRADLKNVDNREATEFQLDMYYQVPDSTAIRTVPLSIPVR